MNNYMIVIFILALVGATVVGWVVGYIVIAPILYLVGKGIVKVVKRVRRKG